MQCIQSTPVISCQLGAKLLRARLKWYSRDLTRRPKLATCTITVPHCDVCTSQSQTVCWAIMGVHTSVLLPSVTEFQYFVTEITLLLLKFSWNFGQNTEVCLNFSVFPHKNTEICVKFCKNTEISAICYWSWQPWYLHFADHCSQV